MKKFLKSVFGFGTKRPLAKRRPRSHAPQLEGLEDRTVLSTLAITPNGDSFFSARVGVANQLTIEHLGASGIVRFTDTMDTIVVAGANAGVVGSGTNTVLVPVSLLQGRPITVNLDDQNDTVNVLSNANPMTINAGAGSDIVNVGNVTNGMSQIGNVVAVNGETQAAGTTGDVLNFIDGTNTIDRTYSVHSNAVIRSGAAPVLYSGVERLVINAASGRDTFNVQSTPADTSIQLNGGSGDDVFRLGSGGSLTPIAGVVTIDGQAGRNWVDYSAVSTGVTVNLTTGFATNVTGGISNIQNAMGSQAGDTLTGNGANNILVGNGGSDTLRGEAGRDILIGGIGADTLIGGLGDDLVIGARTAHDANAAALQLVMLEWQSANDYATRARRISGQEAGGLNGAVLINFQNVTDDGVDDTMFGGDGSGVVSSVEGDRDWFFSLSANVQREVRDRDASRERVN